VPSSVLEHVQPAPAANIAQTPQAATSAQPAALATTNGNGAQAAVSTLATAAPATVPETQAADGAAASMIKALDTDGSGVVEKAEVDAFAKSQGLSEAETAEEFKDLDKNHDGQLDSSEISNTVAQYTSTAAPVPVAAETPAAATPAAVVPAAPATPTAVTPAAVVPTTAVKKPELPAIPSVTMPKATETAPQLADTPGSTPTDPKEVVATLVQNTAQADRTVAQLFALKASNDLSKRDKDLEEASKLEQQASSLRAKAQKVASDAIESAEQAAQNVGRKIMEKALDEANDLESQAKKVEGRAASINAKAKVAMAQAIKAQTSASQAVENLVTGSQSDEKI